MDAIAMHYTEHMILFFRVPDNPSGRRLGPTDMPEGWDYYPEVKLDRVPPDLALWPVGADRPEAVLCSSLEDPKHFRVFKYRREIDPAVFLETGLYYRGFRTMTGATWDKLTEYHAKAILRWNRMNEDEPVSMDTVEESS